MRTWQAHLNYRLPLYLEADLDCLQRQACVALSNHLLADPSSVLKHDRIVELGAGVGLLSLVSAKLSAGGAAPKTGGAEPRIVATDVDEKVLEVLETNIAESESSFLRRYHITFSSHYSQLIREIVWQMGCRRAWMPAPSIGNLPPARNTTPMQASSISGHRESGEQMVRGQA